MAKRIAFIVLLVAALVCGTWGYFYLQQLKTPSVKAIDVLPDSCFFLAEVKDPQNLMQQLTRGNLMWEDLQKITGVKELNATLLVIDSLLNANELKDYAGNQSLFIALYGSHAANKIVFAFNLKDVNETENVKTFFEKKFSAKPLSGKSSLYRCEWQMARKKTSFYLYIDAGLVLFSGSDTFLATISANEKKNTLSANKDFMEATHASAKDGTMNLYIHFPHFYRYGWNGLFSDKASEYFANEKERWISADAGIEPSELNARGFLPNDTTALYVPVKNQDADDFKDLFAHLPYATAWLEAVNISNYGYFVRDNYAGNAEKRKSDLKKYSDSLAADAQGEMATFVGSYAAAFNAIIADTLCGYGIVNINDAEKANSFFKNTADSVLANNDTANLFYYADRGLFKNICANFFREGFSYVTIINECAVFSNSVKALAEYGKTVSEINNFKANERGMGFLKDHFSADLNYLYYANVFKTKDKLRSYMSKKLDAVINEAPELYEKFDAIAFSLQKTKTGIFFTAQAGFNPQYKMYQNTLWETVVDTDLYKLPVSVINHLTNENELICQDMKNNLYLLSNTGRTVWKKNVHEKILGDIQQVDYFKNGKLQLLFVTENYIHIIDRNGNYIDGFPVKIKAGASGGISLFDYDHSKNYRMWIPLKNNTVICLGITCKAVEGFVPVQIKAPLVRAIRQIVVQQKDHFVLTDTLGNVYVVNRKGEERTKISSTLPKGNYPLYYDIGKDPSKSYLCWVDVKTKTFMRLSLSDAAERIQLPSAKEITGFFFDTLQAKAAPLLVLVSEKLVEAYDLFGKKIREIKSSDDMQAQATALDFWNKVHYVALENESGNLMLADKQARAFTKNEIKLSSLPGAYDLIKGQPRYLVGYYQNKIFCLKQ